MPTKRTPTESAQHEEAWINWKRCTKISPREIRIDSHEFTGLECNNWIFINLLLTSSWSWTLLPPYMPWRFIDKRREQLKLLKWVGFHTCIAHISFIPLWSMVLTWQFSQLYSAHTKWILVVRHSRQQLDVCFCVSFHQRWTLQTDASHEPFGSKWPHKGRASTVTCLYQ